MDIEYKCREQEIKDFSRVVRKIAAQMIILCIRDFDEAKKRNSAQYIDSKSWIRGTGTEIFSFNWCCEMLNINPNAARRKICNGKTNDRHRQMEEALD